jgi:hypothetical protein
MATILINLRGRTGLHDPTYCGTYIYIGRPSRWGNPFTIGRDGTREQVIERYKAYVLGNPALMAALPELKDKVLGCWCTPLPCHGDVLVELADRLSEPLQC